MRASRAFLAAAVTAVVALPRAATALSCAPLVSFRFTGLAQDAGYVWALQQTLDDSDHSFISKIDAASRVLQAQSGVLPYNGRGICVGCGSLWVTDALVDVVHELDPATFQEKSRFSTPGTEPCGIAFDGDHLWVSDPWYQRVSELTTSGVVVSQFTIPNAYRTGLEWEGNGLWMPSGASEISHYRTDGTIDRVASVSCPGPIFDLAIRGQTWFLAHEDVTYEVVGAGGACQAFVSYIFQGVDYHANSVWATVKTRDDSDHTFVVEIDAATGVVLTKSAVLDYNGRGVCYGRGSLWVTDALADVVHELDPLDFRERSQFQTPGTEPNGIAFDGRYLWLTDPWRGRIDKLSTTGAVFGGFAIPNAFRTGLERDAGGGLWTPTAASELTHYLADGTRVGSFSVCPPETVWDTASDGSGRMYLSGLRAIYVGHGVPTTAVAAAGWATLKSLYR